MRISVVGCSGAGKTTVGRRIADALACDFIELDALHWGPNWTAATAADMLERARAVVAADRWVVDGNYHDKIGTVIWDRADTVVWVDLPRWRVMTQALQRSLRRGVLRQQLWNGNRESLSGLMFWRGDESIVHWAWDSFPRTQERYEAAMADTRFSRLSFVRLRSRRDIDAFVESIVGQGRS